MRPIAIILLALACLGLSGCWAFRVDPDTSVSPAGAVVSGALSGGATGGPLGAILGVLTAAASTAAVTLQRSKSKRDRAIAEMVGGVGEHLSGAPVDQYRGLGPAEIVARERARLLDELSRHMDGTAKDLVRAARKKMGLPLDEPREHRSGEGPLV